jgi:signal transduction histidine kinase
MLAAQAAKKHIQIEDLLAPGSIVVQSDAEQLTQVILNLLLNAIQILPAGGHVAIASTVEVESVSIEIADDGPGIAVDDRDRIFEAFFFRREGGVGLGLAVVKQIVDAHGGEIEVGRSQLGGALFTIRLPRTSAKDL